MENGKGNDEIEIDLVEIFQVLIGRAWLILGAGILCAFACFAVSKFVLTPIYESTTKIYILNKTGSAAVTYSDMQMGTQLTKDYAELIGSRYVLEEVIAELSLDMEYEELLEVVSVETPADTRIVSITVEDASPVRAMDIANSIREAASGHIQNVMDIEAVNVVEDANLPTEKSKPSVALWTLAGGAAGLFLLCAIILARHLMDDTIKSSEDVEKYLGLGTLALIPVTPGAAGKAKGRKKKR